MRVWNWAKKIEGNETPEQSNAINLAKLNIRKQAAMIVIAFAVTLVLVFAMTVAWYSNVIHVEGLVFSTASWKFQFEGKVQFGDGSMDQTIAIAPGDSGVVDLTLTNDGDSAITVLVNTLKTSGMSQEMQKRIYFYVDDSKLINGEVVDRIYVNETDKFAYTVLAQNVLKLGEEYHSDVNLKWEWVYDVLGYYVSGSLQEDGSVEIHDYMRPVTYDLDRAVFDDAGRLVTIDNGTSRGDFLQKLYETDGYVGTTVPQPTAGGYYPVAVDGESNYGIWLYLYDKAEIASATAIDNVLSLGNSATQEDFTFTARILLTGEQKRVAESLVADANTLREQLANSDIDKVTLQSNLDLTNSDVLTIASGRNVVLDLNGKTLTLPKEGKGFEIEEGGSLTVIGGTILGNPAATAKNAAFTARGGELTLSKVTMEGVYRGILVEDQLTAEGMDSRIRISNSKITAEDLSVFLRGNGEVSGRKTYLLVENSTIYSGEKATAAICGNGSDEQGGTEIEIRNSTIEGGYSAIYHPQADSILTIKGSTLTGATAIAIKAGEITILDSTVHGTYAKGTAGFAGSGFTDTGDAIYIETNYNRPVTLTIGSSTDSGSQIGSQTLSRILSDHSEAIQIYEPDASQVSVRVRDGIYSTDVSAYLEEGYTCTQQADGKWFVGKIPAGESN